MSKTKTPFFGLGSQGSIGNTLTTQRYAGQTIIRAKPKPTDPRTDRQLWHRYLYRQACQYWNTLTPAQKQSWQTNATPYHMTGFAFFLRWELKRLSNLILCLPLDEGAGATVYDYSGLRNNGIIYGASWTTGIIGSALYFDGTNDLVDLHTPTSLNLTNEISIEAWCRPDAISNWRTIINKQTGMRSSYCLRIWNNRFAWIGGTAGTWVFEVYATTIITPGQWYHLVAQYKANHFARLYVDHILEGEDTTVGQITLANTIWELGHKLYDIDYWWKGALDEIRLYDDLLSQNEITRHHLRRGS